MKSDYTTNSRYITHTIAFWKVGRIHFLSSGVKGLGTDNVIAQLKLGGQWEEEKRSNTTERETVVCIASTSAQNAEQCHFLSFLTVVVVELKQKL